MRMCEAFNGRRVLIGAATLEAGRGGIARVARMTARALAEGGAMLTPLSYLDTGDLQFAGVPVACAGGGKLRFAILNKLRGVNCDCFVYDSAGIARAHPHLLSRGAGYVVWMHGIEAWEQLRPDHARAFRRATLVLVNSHYTLERFRALHGDLPGAQVCWLATEEDQAPPARAPCDAPPTVLVLSRIDLANAYKGHAELIEAWPDVCATVQNARLIIAGDGTGRREIERQAIAAGIAESVEFLGFVPESNLSALWQRVDVFAMPSRKEGFGIVYAEAMRQGIPVVASVHDAGREINVDGETGFNVDLGEHGALAERLIQLLTDVQLRRRMGEAGRARWNHYFRYGLFRERVLDLMSNLASRVD